MVVFSSSPFGWCASFDFTCLLVSFSTPRQGRAGQILAPTTRADSVALDLGSSTRTSYCQRREDGARSRSTPWRARDCRVVVVLDTLSRVLLALKSTSAYLFFYLKAQTSFSRCSKWHKPDVSSQMVVFPLRRPKGLLHCVDSPALDPTNSCDRKPGLGWALALALSLDGEGCQNPICQLTRQSLR